MKKLIVFILAAVLCLGFCSCGKDNTSGMDQYVGNTYVGTAPWENALSIAVNSCDGSTVTVYIEEELDGEHVATGEYSGELDEDNTVTIQHNYESVEDGHGVKINYTKQLAFKDGTIAVTYLDGQVTTVSPLGDSGAHHAGALTDENNTVVLEKK